MRISLSSAVRRHGDISSISGREKRGGGRVCVFRLGLEQESSGSFSFWVLAREYERKGGFGMEVRDGTALKRLISTGLKCRRAGGVSRKK